MSGKGSNPRPFSVSQEEFGNNYDRIFGRKDKKVEDTTEEVGKIDLNKELEDVDRDLGIE